jgi:hypothetical protein
MFFYCAVNVRLKNSLSIENFYFLKINRSNRILLGKNGFDLFLNNIITSKKDSCYRI